jgi:hypothetical protein
MRSAPELGGFLGTRNVRSCRTIGPSLARRPSGWSTVMLISRAMFSAVLSVISGMFVILAALFVLLIVAQWLRSEEGGLPLRNALLALGSLIAAFGVRLLRDYFERALSK